ncbi:hypothetical protein KKF05_05175 [Patescibacteria group bacterium]|nr:hypothetical protein [Patescibacteria group bacterium]MBU1916231.1 hypothetical protein [Patescibacteria group bacterium]
MKFLFYLPSSFYEIIGWVGTFLILFAYFLGSMGKMKPESRGYAFVNLLGAIAVGSNVWHNHAWPALGLQVMWGCIALFTLAKGLFRPGVNTK